MHVKIGLKINAINAIKIPISKQNYVLYNVTQKIRKNEWNVYNVCQPQKILLTNEKSHLI